MAVDLVEEEPERELLEPEDEELGLTRWALGASASSLQSNTAGFKCHENRNTPIFARLNCCCDEQLRTEVASHQCTVVKQFEQGTGFSEFCATQLGGLNSLLLCRAISQTDL